MENDPPDLGCSVLLGLVALWLEHAPKKQIATATVRNRVDLGCMSSLSSSWVLRSLAHPGTWRNAFDSSARAQDPDVTRGTVTYGGLIRGVENAFDHTSGSTIEVRARIALPS